MWQSKKMNHDTLPEFYLFLIAIKTYLILWFFLNTGQTFQMGE